MLHVPRFHRREKSQEVSLKRAVGSRHSRILNVTRLARDAPAGNRKCTSLFLSLFLSFCLSLSFSTVRAWIHYVDEQIFFQCRYSWVTRRERRVRAAIDLVFSGVTIKHLMSRCVSERFDGVSGIDSGFESSESGSRARRGSEGKLW